jgi:hypothetical protein
MQGSSNKNRRIIGNKIHFQKFQNDRENITLNEDILINISIASKKKILILFVFLTYMTKLI